METRKVTTVSMIIALVWLTSEVAAYPEEPDLADIHDNGLNCGRSSISHSEFQKLGGNLHGLSDTTIGLIAPPITTPLHQHQDTRDDACSFDFDLNKTHTLDVVR